MAEVKTSLTTPEEERSPFRLVHTESTHSPGFYVAIYFALLLFTGLSVGISAIFREIWSHTVLTGLILILSTIKAFLIVAYYMHLKHEGNAVRMWLYLSLVIFILVLLVFMPDIIHPVKR